ncbi:uncharacterized protein LOC141529542 [Cotesia typhae]|uniref:uncharacterized protein LOC141529542 n=1 Tax=Cotesia typhae TaxID=2053667 RepID=UPI003D690943
MFYHLFRRKMKPQQQLLTMSFTCDEEIRQWVVYDDTVNLVGYIKHVKEVARRMTQGITPIIRIIVSNNDNSDVCINFFEDQADFYRPFIRQHAIIKIVRARSTPVEYEHVLSNDKEINDIGLTVLAETEIDLKRGSFNIGFPANVVDIPFH